VTTKNLATFTSLNTLPSPTVRRPGSERTLTASPQTHVIASGFSLRQRPMRKTSRQQTWESGECRVTCVPRCESVQLLTFPRNDQFTGRVNVFDLRDHSSL
jgi:hypothetical protein